MRPSIAILVSLVAGCADRSVVDSSVPFDERIGELETCAVDIVCVGTRTVMTGPAGAGLLYAPSDDVRALVMESTPPLLAGPAVLLDVGLDMIMPPISRALPATDSAPVLLGRRAAVTPAIANLGLGVATSRLHDGVALGLLESEVDETIKQDIAGGMISLGAPHSASYAVLERGLLASDRAVVTHAAAVLEHVAPAIPEDLKPGFASLLREQGVSAAFLD